VAELHRTNEQAGHDLVADAEHERGVEHVVRQAHGGGQRDHVAREQRQLHAGRALRDAVAHGGHATGHLCGGAERARVAADQLGVVLVGLVGREHVVVGGDHAHVRRALGVDLQLVGRRQGGRGVGHVGAAHAAALGAVLALRGHAGEVGAARAGAALDDALRDAVDGGVQGRGHGVFLFSSSRR
jgi:hypothetical protein